MVRAVQPVVSVVGIGAGGITENEKMKKKSFNGKEILDEYVRRIHKKFPRQINKILLFGSQARGDSGQHSDVDVLIVLNTNSSEVKEKIQDLCWDVMMDYDFASFVSPIIFLKKQYQQYKKWNSSFLSIVFQEGIPL